MSCTMVKLGCTTGCGSICGCSTGQIVKKTWAMDNDKPFKLLTKQPLTLKERKEAEKEKLVYTPLPASAYRSCSYLSGELRKDEKIRVSTQLGVHVESKQEMHAIVKQKGLHILEKGEVNSERWQEALSTGRTTSPAPADVYGTPDPKPVDFHKLHYENVQRFERDRRERDG